MGFMDELRKLTQPYDDEDDFFEGADSSLRQPAQPSAAQLEFESTFGEGSSGKPEPEAKPQQSAPEEGGGLFGGLGGKKAAKPKAKPKAKSREKTVAFGGTETQVILFSPKTFDEAGELLNFLGQGRSVVMTLEGVPTDNARRLLDFLSGVTYAPQNVDVVGAQSEQPESDSHYL